MSEREICENLCVSVYLFSFLLEVSKMYNGAVALTHKHVFSVCLQSWWLSSCALPEELCYLRELGEVRGQEPLELFCSPAAATRKVAFLILSPSPGTQQEKALMASACVVIAEKNTCKEQVM